MLCKILEDIWETVRDLCPEMQKPLEWQGQDEPWNSPKWRQQSLQGAIVADVGEAYDVAKAALPVFGKVLKEVSQRFHFSRAYFISGDLEMWHSEPAHADECKTVQPLQQHEMHPERGCAGRGCYTVIRRWP